MINLFVLQKAFKTILVNNLNWSSLQMGWVVLNHDTRFNEALFMHNLSKHAHFKFMILSEEKLQACYAKTRFPG